MSIPSALRLWVSKLEDGSYTQAAGRLRSGDSFCCLGVMCDLADPDGWDGNRFGPEFVDMPPEEVLLSFGVSQRLASIYAEMNDELLPFKEIAVRVRADFPKAFA